MFSINVQVNSARVVKDAVSVKAHYRKETLFETVHVTFKE